VNKAKPRFKGFEMYGNLPAALRRGTVVSASKYTSKQKEVEYRHMRMEIPKSAEGGAMTTNARRTTNIRILMEVKTHEKK